MSRAQELAAIFDKAVQGVIDQGCQSINGTTCQYRDSQGRKCAVGMLLTDEQIKTYDIRSSMLPGDMPRTLIQELVPNEPTYHAREFLRELQNAHDGAPITNFIHWYKLRCQQLADRWGITQHIKVDLKVGEPI